MILASAACLVITDADLAERRAWGAGSAAPGDATAGGYAVDSAPGDADTDTDTDTGRVDTGDGIDTGDRGPPDPAAEELCAATADAGDTGGASAEPGSAFDGARGTLYPGTSWPAGWPAEGAGAACSASCGVAWAHAWMSAGDDCATAEGLPSSIVPGGVAERACLRVDAPATLAEAGDASTWWCELDVAPRGAWRATWSIEAP